MGDIATKVDADFSDAVKDFAASCEIIGWNKINLLNALESYRTIGIRTAAGKVSENLIYGLRQDGEGKNLFICHAENSNRKVVDPKESYIITITGEYAPTLLDSMTGEIYPIAAEYENGNTLIRWDCYAQSSLLLRLEPGRSDASAVLTASDNGCMSYLSGEAEVILSEPNVLVLDMGKWKIDDGEWQEREETLRICNMAKESLGMSTGATHGAQPWVVEKEEAKNTITTELAIE